jgi:MFS family permease
MLILTKKQKIFWLFIAFFIFAISEAQIAYVQSTFLNQFFSLETIGLIFISAYILAFIAINQYPNFIARFNNLPTAIFILLLKIFSFFIFIFSINPVLIFLAFIIYIISLNLIFVNFDIFLEAFTENVKTGKIRGKFFTFYNIGWLISPYISGQIMDHLGFNWLFAFVIVLILPVILILLFTFQKFENHYHNQKFYLLKTLKEINKKPNIKKIFYLAFLLSFFYAVMVVYAPLYLNKYIGLSWPQIGLIFTFMLLPFVLLEYPAGYLADKYWGEKELMTAGILLTAIAVIAIFLLDTKSLLVWGVILFISRIGASLMEIMRESYFFKKVDVEDLELINAFRATTPFAYILAPLLIDLILLFLPINYIFLFLGLIMLSGLYFSLTLKDTK